MSKFVNTFSEVGTGASCSKAASNSASLFPGGGRVKAGSSPGVFDPGAVLLFMLSRRSVGKLGCAEACRGLSVVSGAGAMTNVLSGPNIGIAPVGWRRLTRGGDGRAHGLLVACLEVIGILGRDARKFLYRCRSRFGGHWSFRRVRRGRWL